MTYNELSELACSLMDACNVSSHVHTDCRYWTQYEVDEAMAFIDGFLSPHGYEVNYCACSFEPCRYDYAIINDFTGLVDFRIIFVAGDFEAEIYAD